MQRRPRIKAVANLSASRRPASKSNAESQIKTSEGKKEKEKSLEQASAATSSKVELQSELTVSNVDSSQTELSEQSVEVQPPAKLQTDSKLPNQLGSSASSVDDPSTFKTPPQMPRNEKEPVGSPASHSNANRFKKFKVAPRLTVSRNLSKFQEQEEATKKPSEPPVEQVKDPPPVIEHEVPAAYDFAPPTPTRTRPETPREMLDSPSFTVNHNVQHPGAAPPSPFPYFPHGHGRIRTESLCSMKSNREVTVANLQPRKNIRTEDQKIIDIKRESRERLSNKALDKSQLRMFDMIYFNPQNNPMKPRSPHKTEKPKTIELLEEPIKEETISQPATAMPVPQLRLNANGEMVLDETSLVVENEQQKQTRILLANTNIVYDDDLSSGGYYKRQKRTRAWNEEETVKFYRVLNTVGPDFSLMLNLFPNRSRRDLKLKFKNEERYNPVLIDKALLKYNIFDLDGLKQEFDQEEADRRKEAEAKSNSEVKELVKRKILKKQEAKLKAEKQAQSRIEKILTDGDLALEIANSQNSPTDTKENLDLTLAASVPKKRQNRKRPVVELPNNESLDENALSHEDPIAVKRPRKPRKKLVTETVAVNSEEIIEPQFMRNVESPDLNSFTNVGALQSVFNPVNMEEIKQLPDHYHRESPTHLPDFQNTFRNETSPSTHHLISEEQTEIMPDMTAEAFNFQNSSPSTFLYDQPTTSNYIAEAVEIEQPQIQTENMEEENKSNNVTALCAESTALDCNDEPLEVPVQVPIEEIAALHNEPLGASVQSPVEEVAPSIAANVQDKIALTSLPQETEITDLSQNILPDKNVDIKPKPKVKSRKKKFKPTLVTRVKLDVNGEMVLDETPTANVEADPDPLPAIDEPVTTEKSGELSEPTQIPLDENVVDAPPIERNESFDNIASETQAGCSKSMTYSTAESVAEPKEPSGSADVQIETEQLGNPPIEEPEVAVDENLNETGEPSKSGHEHTTSFSNDPVAFDEEAFLDSLDLEKFVLVETVRNGKDVYEIHEILDPDTQEISDKPLDLPARVVDLILNVMSQHEDEDD